MRKDNHQSVVNWSIAEVMKRKGWNNPLSHCGYLEEGGNEGKHGSWSGKNGEDPEHRWDHFSWFLCLYFYHCGAVSCAAKVVDNFFLNFLNGFPHFIPSAWDFN